MEIKPGTVFDTDFEVSCVAVESPDEDCVFDAFDSDGVLCAFSTVMVIGHQDHREPISKPAPKDRLGAR